MAMAVASVAAVGAAAQRSLEATRAFDRYIADVEAGFERGARPGDPGPTGFRVEAIHGGTWAVDGGLLHHWRAMALAPGAKAVDLLALLRDYDHLARYYTPDVMASRRLAGGDEAATIAMRFRKQKVVTVVLDAEFETRPGLSGPGRGYSISRSTHIWQVDGAGSKQERRRTEGNDDGFLWRLNSYWMFEETPEGLRMQCDAVSLTRDVPLGLGWLVTPVIATLPRQSLEFTMTATQKALEANR
jgi:hypothetical protein